MFTKKVNSGGKISKKPAEWTDIFTKHLQHFKVLSKKKGKENQRKTEAHIKISHTKFHLHTSKIFSQVDLFVGLVFF